MCGTAAAASSRSTVMRTSSEPVAGKRRHLPRRSLDVGGIGIGHGLHDHRRAAAHWHAADIDGDRLASLLRARLCGHRLLLAPDVPDRDDPVNAGTRHQFHCSLPANYTIYMYEIRAICASAAIVVNAAKTGLFRPQQLGGGARFEPEIGRGRRSPAYAGPCRRAAERPLPLRAGTRWPRPTGRARAGRCRGRAAPARSRDRARAPAGTGRRPRRSRRRPSAPCRGRRARRRDRARMPSARANASLAFGRSSRSRKTPPSTTDNSAIAGAISTPRSSTACASASRRSENSRTPSS